VVAAKEISAGRMPPNAAIQGVLSTARQTIETEKAANPTLAQGEAATKLQNVIAATQQHIQEKNADEKYQRFVEHTAGAAQTGTNVGGQAVAAAKGPADQTARQMPPMGQLVRTLASSQEFRATLLGVWNWLQQMFAGVISAPNSAEAMKSAVKGEPVNAAAAQEGEALWQNFVGFIRVLGSHPDYQRAVEGLFGFIDMMSDAVPEGVSTADTDLAKAQSRQVFTDARAIIEELAGGYSMTTIIEQARSIRSLVKADQRIQFLLRDSREFVEAALRQPTLLESDAEIARGRGLLRQATAISKEYKDSIFVRQFFANVSALLSAIRTDPSNQRLAAAFKDFGTAFVSKNPETGLPEVNATSINEMRQLLIPLVMEQLRSVSISTIEGSNDTYDFKFDGIVLAANDIAPDRIRVKYDNDLEFDFRTLSVADAKRSDLTIYFEGMRTRLDNVRFWYQRKSFPKISDEGVANVTLDGDGMDLKFRVHVAPTAPYFHVQRVDCDIDRMKMKIVEAKHSALDKIVTSVFSGAIRKRVELAIEQRLAIVLQRVEAALNRLAAKASDAATTATKSAPGIVEKVMQAAASTSANTAPASSVGSANTAGYAN